MRILNEFITHHSRFVKTYKSHTFTWAKLPKKSNFSSNGSSNLGEGFRSENSIHHRLDIGTILFVFEKSTFVQRAIIFIIENTNECSNKIQKVHFSIPSMEIWIFFNKTSKNIFFQYSYLDKPSLFLFSRHLFLRGPLLTIKIERFCSKTV
jgi:hypothetical protein